MWTLISQIHLDLIYIPTTRHCYCNRDSSTKESATHLLGSFLVGHHIEKIISPTKKGAIFPIPVAQSATKVFQKPVIRAVASKNLHILLQRMKSVNMSLSEKNSHSPRSYKVSCRSVRARARVAIGLEIGSNFHSQYQSPITHTASVASKNRHICFQRMKIANVNLSQISSHSPRS